METLDTKGTILNNPVNVVGAGRCQPAFRPLSKLTKWAVQIVWQLVRTNPEFIQLCKELQHDKTAIDKIDQLFNTDFNSINRDYLEMNTVVQKPFKKLIAEDPTSTSKICKQRITAFLPRPWRYINPRTSVFGKGCHPSQVLYCIIETIETSSMNSLPMYEKIDFIKIELVKYWKFNKERLWLPHIPFTDDKENIIKIKKARFGDVEKLKKHYPEIYGQIFNCSKGNNYLGVFPICKKTGENIHLKSYGTADKSAHISPRLYLDIVSYIFSDTDIPSAGRISNMDERVIPSYFFTDPPVPSGFTFKESYETTIDTAIRGFLKKLAPETQWDRKLSFALKNRLMSQLKRKALQIKPVQGDKRKWNPSRIFKSSNSTTQIATSSSLVAEINQAGEIFIGDKIGFVYAFLYTDSQIPEKLNFFHRINKVSPKLFSSP